MDFIVGEKFYDIADFIFSTNITENVNEDYNKLENTFDISKLQEINIVYLHTMYKNQFFDVIRPLDNKFIVVTHNSDINIDSVLNVPKNVIKWYSQNINIYDPILESIPIGLENSRWFPHFRKKEKIIDILNTKKVHRNLVYMNHNINTNPMRKIPYDILKDKSFVTTKMRMNGQYYDEYINQIYNHKFVVCPEGNGIDTHRTWETLYLKSIPIEISNFNNSYYRDLPICFVNSWEEITEDFLNKEYERIINTKWNLDKLKMSYWKNKILENVL